MKRLAFIDSLRGLAALYVVVYHMTLIPQPNLDVPAWVTAFVHTGGTGVTLFFIVSAFSLCYTMPSHQRQATPLASFYLRRFFRIAPLFYFMLTVTILRDKWIYGIGHSPKQILASVFFVFNLWPGQQDGIVWASWTVGVEMLFYLIFPLLYRWVRDVASAVVLFLLALLAFILAQAVAVDLPVWSQASQLAWIKASLLKHLPVFGVGMLCFFLFRRHEQGRLSAPSLGLALTMGALYTYAALLNGWCNNVLFETYYWQAVAYALLLLGLSILPLKVFVNRITEFYGEISYSLYLLHPVVVLALAPHYPRIYAALPGSGLAFFACLAVTYSSVTALAWLTYRFVEKPGIALGKRVYQRLAARRASLAAA